MPKPADVSSCTCRVHNCPEYDAAHSPNSVLRWVEAQRSYGALIRVDRSDRAERIEFMPL